MKRVLCAVFVAASVVAAAQQPAPLTIPAIFAEGGITGREPENVKWSPDGQRVAFVLRDDSGEKGALYYVDPAGAKPAVLVAEEKLSALVPPTNSIKDERERERVERYGVAGYHWAPDSKHLLFDSHGQLWYYAIDTGTATQVTSRPEPAGDPRFSPDGSRLAFVRKHELYVRSLDGNARETQLTEGKAGRPGHVNIKVALTDEKGEGEPGADDILNGEVDWLYAEELGVRSNYFWSPDGRQIAYLQMDETRVPTYPIEDFSPLHATVDHQKYPRVGDTNPGVRVGIANVPGGHRRWLNVPGDRPDRQDIYIPRFGWLRAGVLWIQVMNRAQNRLDLYFADAESGRSRLVMSETESKWIEVNDDFKVLGSGDQFLWTSWRDGHFHVYLYRFDKQNPLGADAVLERQLTRGDWDLHVAAFDSSAVKAVDEKNGTVYFMANLPDARQAQLYSVPLAGGEPVRVSREQGSHTCTFPESGGDYYVDNFSAQLTPPRLSLCRGDGSCRTFWEPHPIDAYALTAPKSLELTAADGRTKLFGQLLMPPDAGDRIPLIVYLYGGPAGQVVVDAWTGTTFLYHQLLARRGFAVFSVDNRGTPGRGRDFMAAANRTLGPVEIEDQLAALAQVLRQYPQLDGSRVGIWGWSNGASMTLFAMTHSDRFRAGIAVAPVTDPRLYDSTYTERYLGEIKENAEGYRRSAVVSFAGDLKGRLLLVHGTSDDNVHMQNSIQMIDNLVNAGKQFDLMLYPRKTHSIAGPAARTNLFTRMLDHWEQWLKARSAS